MHVTHTWMDEGDERFEADPEVFSDPEKMIIDQAAVARYENRRLGRLKRLTVSDVAKLLTQAGAYIGRGDIPAIEKVDEAAERDEGEE